MLVLDIVSQARERLGDLKKQRWTDNRLINIVNQGQRDICLETKFLRKEYLMPLIINQTIYTLPSDCVSIMRLEYQEELVPLHSRSDKDIPRAITADFTAYKSNLNVDTLEIVPAPTELNTRTIMLQGLVDNSVYQVTPLYGTITRSVSDLVTIDPLYGAVTDLTTEYNTLEELVSDGHGEIQGENKTIRAVAPNNNLGVVIRIDQILSDDEYGVIVDVEGQLMNGEYGLIADINVLDDVLKVYYAASPVKVKTLETELILPDLWEDLILKYVVGTALQDDNDANNIQRGEIELGKYVAKLGTLRTQSALDFSSDSSDKYVTNYRRI